MCLFSMTLNLLFVVLRTGIFRKCSHKNINRGCGEIINVHICANGGLHTVVFIKFNQQDAVLCGTREQIVYWPSMDQPHQRELPNNGLTEQAECSSVVSHINTC